MAELKPETATWKCKEHCGECCGVHLFSRELWEEYKHLKQAEIKEEIVAEEEVAVLTTDALCVFLDRNSKLCVIYEARPQICRVYGKHLDLPCPYIKPNGNKRSEAQARRMQRIINHDVDSRIKSLNQRIKSKIK
jgi:Fe-S-cluster containining protein